MSIKGLLLTLVVCLSFEHLKAFSGNADEKAPNFVGQGLFSCFDNLNKTSLSFSTSSGSFFVCTNGSHVEIEPDDYDAFPKPVFLDFFGPKDLFPGVFSRDDNSARYRDGIIFREMTLFAMYSSFKKKRFCNPRSYDVLLDFLCGFWDQPYILQYDPEDSSYWRDKCVGELPKVFGFTVPHEFRFEKGLNCTRLYLLFKSPSLGIWRTKVVTVRDPSCAFCKMHTLMRDPVFHQIQGLEEVFGFERSCALDWTKATFVFTYLYLRATTQVDRAIIFLDFVDKIYPLVTKYGVPVAKNLLKGLVQFIQDTMITRCDQEVFEIRSATGFVGRVKFASRVKNGHFYNWDFLDVENFFRKYRVTTLCEINGSPVTIKDVRQGLVTGSFTADLIESDIEGEYDDYVRQFSPSDVPIFLRSVLNSSSLGSALRLLTFVWHLVFVFKQGEIDLRHLERWEAGRTTPEVAVNISATVLDHISLLAGCAQEFYDTGDPRVFLRNDSEVVKFLAEVEQLRIDFEAYPVTENIALGEGILDIERRCHHLLDQGLRMESVVKASAKNDYKKGINVLRNLRLEIVTTARTTNTRDAPFSCLIYGPPKIGKTMVTQILLNYFRLINPKAELKFPESRPLHPEGIYTRTLTEEYWSKWANSNWAIIFDDIGQTHPHVADFAFEINEIVRVNNNAHFCPPMAHVDEKGTRLVAPQIMIATSNNKDLNANFATRCPAAVLRRFPFVITPLVKSEFMSEDGALDGLKARTASDPSDMWTFKVESVELRNCFGTDAFGQVGYKTVSESFTIGELQDWFRGAVLDHFRGQRSAADFTMKLRQGELCGECHRFKTHCACEVVHTTQFGVTEVIGVSVLAAGVLSIAQTLRSFISYLMPFVQNCGTTAQNVDRVAGVFERASCNVESTASNIDGLVNIAIPLVNSFRHSLVCLTEIVTDWLWFKRTVKDRVRYTWEYCEKNKLIIAISVVVVSSIVIGYAYQLFHKTSLTHQGILGSKPAEPVVSTPNAWKARSVITFAECMGPSSHSIKVDDFRKKISRSYGVLSFDGAPGGISSIRCLNVFGQYWLFPKHYFKEVLKRTSADGDLFYRIALGSSFACPGRAVVSGSVNVRDVLSDPESDFCLLKANCAPGGNLLPYMTAVTPYCTSFSATLCLIRESLGVCEFSTGPVVCKERALPSLSILNGFDPQYTYNILAYSMTQGLPIVETVNGDCGSLICTFNEKGCSIVGVHNGILSQEDKIGLALPVKWLQSMFKTLPGVVVQGEINLKHYSLGELHPKCPLNFEGLVDIDRTVLPIGSIKVPLSDFKTQTCENKFAPFWKDRGFVTNKVPPKLPPGMKYMPKRLFLLNGASEKDQIPIGLIRMARDSFLRRILRLVPLRAIKNQTVCDHSTVMWGQKGNDFLNGIDFTTGAGFPYNAPKWRVLKKIEHEDYPMGTYDVTEEIAKEIDEDEDKLIQGVRPNFIFNASLKDEAISQSKLDIGKIRIFQALNFRGLYLLRKFFLSSLCLFQTYNLQCENAIGMDSTGPDWDILAGHLFQDGWKVFCGDYSNFDQHMGSQILENAWDIFIDLARESGNFSEDAIRAMITLKVENCYALTNFFGDLLYLNGTNPSGHSLTVDINSVVNSLYIRIAWIMIVGSMEGFDDNVRLITYGDDNVVSVSPAYQDCFNLVSVSEALARVGVIYGDASKSGIIRKFSPMEEVSFLKRTFVYDSKAKFWRAPLEESSIHKMLIIGTPSRKVETDDRLSSVLLSALEHSFQHGQNYFEELRKMCLQCSSDYGLQKWVELKGGFKTYDQIMEERTLKVSRYGKLREIFDLKVQGIDGLLVEVVNQRTTEINSYQGGEILSKDKCSPRGINFRGTRSNPPNGLFRPARGSAFRALGALMSVQQLRNTALAKTNAKMNLVSFTEEDKGMKVGYASVRDDTVATCEDGQWKDWFARPILIKRLDWSENTALTYTSFQPWYEYFTQPNIINKLKGYTRLRANLKLKVVVNGSPFRYGCAMLSYRPLYNGNGYISTKSTCPYFSGGHIASDQDVNYPGGVVPGASGDDACALLARSQRMNIMIYPQTNSAGEMTCPFIHYRDAIPLADSLVSGSVTFENFREMGTVHVQNVVNLLSTAVANASPVTISIYAWAEDVELWGPSSVTIQGTESDDASATKPSTIVASVGAAAAVLGKVPVIGPYAMATSFAANAVSAILKIFGWSNPPNISNLSGVVPRISFLNPNPTLSFPDTVLAVDARNETTVDPRTVGCEPVDELCIKDFCARPAIFNIITWNTTDAEDTALAVYPVGPIYCQRKWVVNTASPSSNCARISMAPATYVSQLFNYWRGDMVLKIKAVASQFHRGRLAIVYDPIGQYTGPPAKGGSITKIIDLATADEVEFKVPYMAPNGMLQTYNFASGCNKLSSTTFALWTDATQSVNITPQSLGCCFNGQINVLVLNTLQCGDAVAPVKLVCSVSFENMSFACPVYDSSAALADPSSGVYAMAMKNMVVQGLEAPDDSSTREEVAILNNETNVAKIFSGEVVPSLRPLLHRDYLYKIFAITNSAAQSLVGFTIPRFPIPNLSYGKGTLDTAQGTTGAAGSFTTNLVNTTPIAYISGCFVGNRGSMVWKVASTEAYSGKSAYWSNLFHGGAANTAYWGLGITAPYISDTRLMNYLRGYFGSIVNGSSNALQSNNGCVSAVVPMYANIRMFPGNMAQYYWATVSAYITNNLDQTLYNALGPDSVTYSGIVNNAGRVFSPVSVSAGADYTPFGFVNCPDVYLGTLSTA